MHESMQFYNDIGLFLRILNSSYFPLNYSLMNWISLMNEIECRNMNGFKLVKSIYLSNNALLKSLTERVIKCINGNNSP